MRFSNISFPKSNSNFCFCNKPKRLFLITLIRSGSDNEEDEAGEKLAAEAEERVRGLLQKQQLPREVPGAEGDRQGRRRYRVCR